VGRGAAAEALLGRLRRAGVTAVGALVTEGPDAACETARLGSAAGLAMVVHHALVPGGLHDAHASVAAYLEELDALRDAGQPVSPAIACLPQWPVAWLEELGGAVHERGDRLHVVACERPEELAWCRAAHDCRPIELLARAGCLGPHVTIAHATHADGPELDLVAAGGATICACPSGDAHLGTGFLPVNRIVHRAIPLCLGLDGAVVVDPLAELRELEWIARRQKGARRVLPADALLEIGGDRGALALELVGRAAVEVDLGHPALAGVPEAELERALVERCGADVFVQETDGRRRRA
jgi:cytosine/adenosine deaminase-related metal-dependent hydrolase